MEVTNTGEKRIRYQLILTISFLTTLALAGEKEAGVNVGDADLVLLGGEILTLDNASTEVRALAIRDGKIVFTGDDDQAKNFVGSGTQVINLGGKTVIPGLIDSHIHAIRAGLTFASEVRWFDVKSLQEGFEKLRDSADITPPGEWIIVAGGWVKEQMSEQRAPTLSELDAVSTDHPIYIQHQYNLVVLNSAGMEALGITGDVVDPSNGKYERDENNQLTGRISGGLALFIQLHGKLPKPPFEQQVEGTRAFMSELNRLGLTGILDPGGGGVFPHSYRALYKLWQAGELTQRVRYQVSVQSRGNELEDIKQWSDYQTMGHGDGMLRFNGFGEVIIWGMHDGSEIGNPFNASDKAKHDLYETAKYLAEREVTLQIHAQHDHTANQILDIFERVNNEFSIAHLRWTIAHGEDLSEPTLQRMKRLGMGWGVQDRLYYKGDDYLRAMGPKDAGDAPPIRTGLETGVVIGAGTDSHRVAPYNPFISLEWLVTGKSISGTVIRGADESPNREEALRMYTLGSAWMTFDEDQRGSLEVGKLADLAVLSDDYMTINDDDISEIVSLLTIVDGKIVYSAAPFTKK